MIAPKQSLVDLELTAPRSRTPYDFLSQPCQLFGVCDLHALQHSSPDNAEYIYDKVWYVLHRGEPSLWQRTAGVPSSSIELRPIIP